MLNIRIAKHLESTWRDVVNRELDLSLLRLEQQRYSVNLSLKRLAGSNQKRAGYLCAVTIFDAGDMISDFAIDHSDGRFAIRQALARTRRTVARREGKAISPATPIRTASVVQLP